MPSAISHMLLCEYLEIKKGMKYKISKSKNLPYYLLGSISPDLPYASIGDNKLLKNESDLANLLHFTARRQEQTKSPNQVPIRGLSRLKDNHQSIAKAERDALFWFVVGYASHVIADGIFHPFVQDLVGRYEGKNKADHRALEMGIDVLLTRHFTEKSGCALEASYSGNDLKIAGFKDRKYSGAAMELLSDLILEIYDYQVKPKELLRWVHGLSRLFCLSSGKWPSWMRSIDTTNAYVFRQISDLTGKEDQYLKLTKPKYWKDNFLNIESISVIDDCLPRFNEKMLRFLDKAFNCIFQDGVALTEEDLPGFSLDTGRAVANCDELSLKPVLWS